MEENDSGPEIDISSFDYKQILPYHSILIVENEPERAAAIINRILRTVATHHFQPAGAATTTVSAGTNLVKKHRHNSFEQGEIFTFPQSFSDGGIRFRFPKRVHSIADKKQLSSKLLDIYQRQAFEYPFTSDPADPGTYRLHFLPRQFLSFHPLLQNLSEKQFLSLNKLLRIPRAFLVLHHCLGKQWPKNENLSRMLSQHNMHHRLLLIVSCPSTQSIPKEVCEQFDWIFYFEHELETQWKRWYRLAFEPFFLNSKIFLHFMRMTKKTQGLVIHHPFQYQELASNSSKLRFSLLPSSSSLNEDHFLQQNLIYIVKNLRLTSILNARF